MYLKTLTLKGFKSFATPIHMSLEPGVTCVVGPNGSGKSNVVDALAWVMGEQGAKNLRGGQMSDVIFAGTKTKSALGRAEVQLTIDNTDGSLPIDYSEVTISRTMFRSGGSEYAINGSPVRLLDIQELLSDTGMGRQMHVIVGQGQLDAILSASELERRAFIEEAAGVLKHRQRKDRALRKLDSLAVNLSRVQDLTNEVGKRLGPLAKQAAAARKAARVQAEADDASARLLADAVVTQRGKLQSRNATREEIEAVIANLDAQIAQLRSKQAAAKASLEEVSPGLEALTQTWSRLGRVTDGLESLVQRASDRLQSLQETAAESAVVDTGELQARLERAQTQVEEKTAEVASLTAAQQAAADAQQLAKDVETEVRQQIEQAQRAVADRRERLERLRGAVSTAASLVKESRASRERLLAGLRSAEEREAQAAQELEQLQQTLPKGEADQAIIEKESRLSGAVAALAARVEELRKDSAEARTEAARWEARRGVLAKTLKPQDAAGAVLDSGLSGVKGVLAELLVVEAGWEEAVGAVLGPWSGALLTKDVPAATDAIRYVREHQAGQVHLLVENKFAAAENHKNSSLSALPVGCHWVVDLVKPRSRSELPVAVAELLDGVAACQDLATARELITKGSAPVVVTAAGDYLSQSRVVGGGDTQAAALRMQAEYDDAADAAEVAEKEALEVENELLKAQGELEKAQGEQEVVVQELAAANARAAEVATALAGAQAHQASAVAEAQRVREDMEKATIEADLRAAKLGEAEKALEEADADESLGTVSEPDYQAQLETALDAVRQAQEAYSEARIAATLAAEQLSTARSRVQSLERNIANLEAAARAAAERARIRQRRQQRAQHVFEQANVALALARTASEQAGERRESMQRSSEELSVQQESLRAALEDLQKQRTDHNEHSLRDQVAMAELSTRLEQLLEEAQQKLGLEESALVADFGPHNLVPVFDDDGEVADQVAFVRSEQVEREKKSREELRRIGTVNPLALADHEAAKARHQFLADQLADLKKSRADLMDVVEQVDTQVRTVFGSAFADVAKSFQEIFQVLFPGGEGRLELTDPKDLLNTGIDIQVRPAGKNVKRMSLLSGGERSLAALAFLFAIFLARPSPFYVLDEVEAALDDTNLSRLLGVFEILRKNSQLIIITHHKRTMEIADALYGVTMREGTTTVISQRLSPV